MNLRPAAVSVISKIEDRLTVPVVPITTIRVPAFHAPWKPLADKNAWTTRLLLGVTHMAIHSIAHLIEAKVRSKGLYAPLEFSATQNSWRRWTTGSKGRQTTITSWITIDHVTKDLEIALDTQIKKRRWPICALHLYWRIMFLRRT